MIVELEKLPKSGIKLKITIPANKVKEALENVLKEAAKTAQVEGYRKGHAPLDMVKDKVDINKLHSEVISVLVRMYYPQALKDKEIKPIISPRIEVTEFDPSKDFSFTAETAERPEIKIGDYKKALKDLHTKKSEDKEEIETHGHVHISPNDVVDALVSVSQTDIPDIVMEEEVNRMLSRLVEQIQPLNLTMDQYLKSISKTSDELRKDYSLLAAKSVIGEMALSEIVSQEKMEVTESEVDSTIEATGDPKLKEQYANNPLERAYVKSIIARNKLIWGLISDLDQAHAPKEQNEDKLKDKKEDTDDK